MSEVIRVLAVVAIIGYVIGRQLMGEPLRGKRVVLLPAVLAVAGAADLGTHGRHVHLGDVVCLVISGLIAVTIGVLQGRMIRLESRNGALWGQLPVRGLWLWALLVGSRLIMTVIALAIGAKVAGSSAPIIMLLGINRLGQAAIVMFRRRPVDCYGAGAPVSGPAEAALRVIVADDQASVREGLVLLLGMQPGIEVTAAAADGQQALDLVAEHHPDAILLDLHMPVVDGIEATRMLTAEHPEVAIVVLTTYADDTSVLSALRAGARSYLTKDADSADIARALHSAARGLSVMDPAVQATLLAAAELAARHTRVKAVTCPTGSPPGRLRSWR